MEMKKIVRIKKHFRVRLVEIVYVINLRNKIKRGFLSFGFEKLGRWWYILLSIGLLKDEFCREEP